VAGWFDSHCHVQEEFLRGEEGTGAEGDVDGAGPGHGRLEEILSRARDAGVDRMVCIGTGLATSRQAVAVARATAAGDATPRVWASIGLHPHDASAGVDEVAAFLEASLAESEADRVVVAVGECGLDYYYEHSPREAQRAAFAAQIELAHARDLALVIHARDAWHDIFDVLDAEGVPDHTVLHCFTGGPDEVDRCLRAGMYVSFSGIVTFKNAADVRAAVERCPLDRLLVETDSPFLAPVPHRGRTNEPAYLPLVGEAVAAVKGCTVDEVRERSASAAAIVFCTGG